MADNLAPLPKRLLGLAMIGLVVALLALCVAFYNKAFTSTVPVTMRIAQVDNSFLPQAEVRMRGVTVGEVTDITSDGTQAVLDIALQSDQASHIPSNVLAQLVPKSLFGERYVSLVSPPNPSAAAIKSGDVIGQDRSSNAIEVERVFDDLMPLLVAVRPADLASTLGALNQALSGRGPELGQTVSRLHDYLSKLNPAIPQLTDDLKQIPKLSDTYSKAAPDLLEGLATLTTTTKTVKDKKSDFATLYSTLTDTSDDLNDFLDDNADNLVHLVSAARPTLDLLARYSPEYVCLFKRLADAVPVADVAFGKGAPRPGLRVTAEIILGRGKFLSHQDEPEITDQRGPMCYSNAYPIVQYPGGPALDGSTHPPAKTPASTTPPTGGVTLPPTSPSLPALPSLPLGSSGIPLLGGSGPGSGVGANPRESLGLANSAPERELVNGLVADMTGSARSDVPGWSSLLVGPLVRGVEVTVK
jgi:virulence factor Mce-like protein